MLKPWWERFPDRLQYELDELEKLGVRAELDKTSLENGRAELRLQAANGDRLNLIVRFPELYPYFRFEIFAPDLALPHHQNPFLKNLCLIGSPTHNWHTHDTVADFIHYQLPRVLRTAQSANPDEVAADEENQAEPITIYYPYEKDSLVLLDGAWKLDSSVIRGELTIAIDPRSGPLLRGTVIEVRDAHRTLLARADPLIFRAHHQTVRARWIRVPEPVLERDPRIFLSAISSQDANILSPRWQRAGNSQVDIVGVIFPEEVSRRRTGDGWIFIVRVRVDRKGFRPGHSWQAHFAKAERTGREDMSQRVPELNTLSEKAVGVVGLGCIGAPSVLEFARTGMGKIHILDGDLVEPSTTVRWPLGLSAAGRSKAEVLASFVSSEYPYTNVSAWHHKLGDPLSKQDSDLKVLEEFFSGLDLIYDATAELGVQHLLSDLAREKAVSLVSISTTPGGWGGRIARIVPSRTEGCWFCLQTAIEDETIPAPPADPSQPVQPAGCATPTFTGASFDVTEISLAGVRLAVATLCSLQQGAYPDFEWDVAVLSLRNERGRPIAPQWKTYPLRRHPACKVCAPQ